MRRASTQILASAIAAWTPSRGASGDDPSSSSSPTSAPPAAALLRQRGGFSAALSPSATHVASTRRSVSSDGGGGVVSRVRTFDLSPLPPSVRKQWDAAANSCKRATIIEPTSTRMAHWRCQACHGEFRRRVDSHVRRGGDCPHCISNATAQPSSSSTTSASSAVGTGSGAAADSTKMKQTEGLEYLRELLLAAPRLEKERLAAGIKDLDAALLTDLLGELSALRDEARGTEHGLSPNARRVLVEQHIARFGRTLGRIHQQRDRAAAAPSASTTTATMDDIVNRNLAQSSRRPSQQQQQSQQQQSAEDHQQHHKAQAQGRAVLDRATYAPMLARPWERYAHHVQENTPLFVSNKLDGVRCVVAWDRLRKQPIFLSRHGNPFESADRIAAVIAPLFERDPDLVLDGELYIDHAVVDGVDFGALLGAVKASRGRRTPAHEAVQAQLQYHVFDMMHGRDISARSPFTTRLAALERALATLPSGTFVADDDEGVTDRQKRAAVVRLVAQQATTKKYVVALLDAAIANGYEGLIVRVGDGVYELGKRTMALLKVKRMHDAEFEVVGVVEGKGRLKGMVGAIECLTDGRPRLPFRAMFGVADTEREHWWNHQDKIVGKRATVRYQEITPAGVPRFGQFKCVRSDADRSDFV